MIQANKVYKTPEGLINVESVDSTSVKGQLFDLEMEFPNMHNVIVPFTKTSHWQEVEYALWIHVVDTLKRCRVQLAYDIKYF